MKWDTPEPLLLISFFFFSKTSPPHFSLFLTKMNQPLSGQISDETWYTWWYLVLTIYPDGHSQNQ